VGYYICYWPPYYNLSIQSPCLNGVLSVASFYRVSTTIAVYVDQNNDNNNVGKDNIMNHIYNNIITIVLADKKVNWGIRITRNLNDQINTIILLRINITVLSIPFV